MYKYTLLLLIAGLFLGSCKDGLSPEEQLEADKIALRQYIADKGLQVDSTASGLFYVHTLEGTGGNPNSGSTVTVAYKGYFLNGNIFDQTEPGKPATFSLGGLILGWREGIPLMKKGGRTTLLLPSALAYGTTGSGSIPPNTPIVFDIDLVDYN